MSYLDKDGLARFWADIKAYIANLLTGYVKTTDIENFFMVDENGGIMPAENPTVSTLFELDSNNDIEPKEVA